MREIPSIEAAKALLDHPMPRPWDMEISAPSIGDLLEAAAACPFLLLPDERSGLNRGTHRLATGDLYQPVRYCPPGEHVEAWLRPERGMMRTLKAHNCVAVAPFAC